MTEAEMRGLIERADAVKGDRARERIEAARSQARKQAGVPAEKPETGEPQAEEVEYGGVGPEAVQRNRGRAGRMCGRGEHFSLAACSSCSWSWRDGRVNWTAAERLYLSDYLKSGARAKLPAAKARYTLLQGMTAKGQQLLVIGDEIEAVKGQDGRYGYVLTDEGIKAGLVRLQWTTGVYNDRGLHELMGATSTRTKRCGTS